MRKFWSYLAAATMMCSAFTVYADDMSVPQGQDQSQSASQPKDQNSNKEHKHGHQGGGHRHKNKDNQTDSSNGSPMQEPIKSN